jgi:hypothetical protein
MIKSIRLTRLAPMNFKGEPYDNKLPLGTILTGAFREKNHPENDEYSQGCIEIDTADGTFAVMPDAFEFVDPKVVFSEPFNFLKG